MSDSFRNPKTGRYFRFDGFFREAHLLVEFHGHQHYLFPSAFIKELDAYRELRWRDRTKQTMVASDPELSLLVVGYDEPFADVSYLGGKLAQLGVQPFVSSSS